MKKLNQKLATILHSIPLGYDEIWDCCCDHGYLGMHILQSELCKTVHFVDQISSITSDLENKLQRYQASNYEVHTLSAEYIHLSTQHKHCVILAGISGNTTILIMKGILLRNANAHIDFIISPHYHNEAIQAFLTTPSLSITEQLTVIENNQQYEIFKISYSKPNQQVST